MKIAFLGDSITEGCGATTVDNFFINHVGKILGAEVLNYGVGGTRIAKQKEISEVEQWDYDFLSRAETMEKDVDLVVIFGGTNDYGHGMAKLGGIDDDTPYTFFGGIKKLLEYLIGVYGREKIRFILPLRRFSDELPDSVNGVSLSVYVSIIKYVCDVYGIKVLDLFTNGIIKPTTCEGDKFTVDGLHPTDFGHEYIAKIVAEFIKENN